MLSWLARRRGWTAPWKKPTIAVGRHARPRRETSGARVMRIDAEAEALIRFRGAPQGARGQLRRIAKDWGRIALAVAHKTGKRVGLDTATRMGKDASFSLERDRTEPQHQPPKKTDPVDELMRIVSEAPSLPYRVQFLGARTDRGPSILKEVDLRASEPSEAVREAARLRWPPRAIGFRLIDGDGREVFGRDRR